MELHLITNSQRIPRKHRTSIDLDNFNQFKMLKTFFNAKRVSKCVFVCESGHGYHVQLLTKDRTGLMNLHIRRMLGDDLKRLEMDEKALNVCDELIETLFRWKEMDGIKTYEVLVNPLSKAFWSFH